MKTSITKVSVIIPVYNVEAYLGACLDSLDAQIYRNFETVLVDDGSTDNSGSICDMYAKSHEDVIVVHQRNQGLSMARNNGVKESSGDYITFIDSDDYVSSDYLSCLVEQIEQSSADISVGKAIIVWDTLDFRSKVTSTTYKIYSAEEALIRMMYEKEFMCIACAKLYKRELILSHPYPAGVLFEDLATSYKIFGESGSASVSSKTIYFWRHRKDSISKQTINERHLESLAFAQDQIEYMQKRYPKAVSAAKYKYVAKIVSLVPYTFNRQMKSRVYFDELQKRMKEYYPVVIKDKNARWDIKLRSTAIIMGYLPSRCIIGLFERMKPVASRLMLRKRGLV